MFLKRLFKKHPYLKEKRKIYNLIKEGDFVSLKVLFSKPEFYQLPKRKVFQFIHLCANSTLADFRNEMTDFFLSDPNYLTFVRKYQKNFPLPSHQCNHFN